ncbi:hypothetical protein AB0K74_03140 [Streptomyces sp. NPDC056159]|uniref:hypothetical protein n=1 Tax=unclassified Streptomyces TaxID=2593676 RepID=UPI0034227801
MSDRHQGFRGAARSAASVLALRCAALLAVLMWVLPVCTHAVHEVFSVPAASMAHTSTAVTVPDSAAHVCFDTGDGPGDTHCRAAGGAVASLASPVAVPSPQVVGMAAAVWTPDSAAARGEAGVLVHTPGIHQLQVQRT